MRSHKLQVVGIVAILIAATCGAQAQSVINAGTYPAGNYQWRIDTDPGTAGYQIARRVNTPAGSTFDIDIKMASIPAAPPARELRFEVYYDPALVTYVGPPICLPGAFPVPDVCGIDAVGPNWVRIFTQIFACGGWSGEVTVARLTFSVNGTTGVTGFDVKDAMSSVGNPTCGAPIGDTTAVAKAVVVLDPTNMGLSALTVNDVGNAGSINVAVLNPDSDAPLLGIAKVTLRSALQIANAAPNNNRITFWINPGPATITNPLMPQLTDAAGVHVDGTTQPGTGVEVKGPAGASMGFDIVSANNKIQDITINNFTGAANAGVRINGNNNTIQGCRIGTNPAVNVAIPNGNGVIVTAGNNNLIGVPGDGNSISGNTNDGVVLSGGTGTLVRANCIGTNGACNGPLANLHRGVFINGVAGNTIGGTANGSINIIAGNGWDGIEIAGAAASNNQVIGNDIGNNGVAAIANGFAGLYINGAPNNTVGAAGALGRNVISGNTFDGLEIAGPAAAGNVVKNNYIGLDSTGAALPNKFDGVYINGAPNNTIGSAVAGEQNVISGNGVAPNFGHGVQISLAASSGNIVKNNYIGLNPAGNAARANRNDGVRIDMGAHNNVIGGTPGNFISGNLGDGIHITGAATSGNQVFNNSIGVSVAGAGGSALGNGGSGAQVSAGANDNHIGGNFDVIGNVICNSAGDGVLLNGAINTEVRANSIGQNAFAVDQPNVGSGVSMIAAAFNNTVVGNSIYANLASGVFINGPGTDQNDVLQNFIGAAAHGNHFDGIHIGGSAKNNVISVNDIGNNGTSGNAATGNGIHLDAAGTSGNLVTGNQLLGNLGPGVFISDGANSNVIGGDIPEAGNLIDGNLNHGVRVLLGFDNSIRRNIIRFNNLSGVQVVEGTGNEVSRNSIFTNFAVAGLGGLGIDLSALGVTPNDVGDSDGGGNLSQNFPIINSAVGGTFTGALDSLANHTFRLEFFSNPACDPTGFGEGQDFLGAANVTTNAQGNAAFSIHLVPSPPGGVFITATATDTTAAPIAPANNTSEFSPCVMHLVGSLCPADINGDGVVNVDDLLAVINSWGVCPGCPADIAPPRGGDGVVNVDDLLAVINAWGPCP